MITSTIEMPVVAITTTVTVLYIGLGFLWRPSREAAFWSAAFATAMVGSYISLAQTMLGDPLLNAIGAGMLVAPMPLLWSGLRAYRGLAGTYAGWSIAAVVVVPLSLAVATLLGWYGSAFRVAFCAAAVIAVLMFIELVRLGTKQRDAALPLMAVSAAFVVFAVITVLNSILLATGVSTSEQSLHFLRTLNLIGMTVYLVCALVTVLLFTRRTEAVGDRGFERTARTRLERARASSDPLWSLLDIRLDDPDDIRTASSAAYNAALDAFGNEIDRVFPADADIERIRPDCYLVLVPRPVGAVRELVTELLGGISARESFGSMPLRISASVGWVSVHTSGYDYEMLVEAASSAAERAYRSGGDRWERVHGEND